MANYAQTRVKPGLYQNALSAQLDPGGYQPDAGDAPAPVAPPPSGQAYAPPNNTGISGMAQPVAAPSQAYQGGDARAWIQSLLGSGPSSEQHLRSLAPIIDQAFGPGSVQIAPGDNTARGRLHNIPGYGMVTVLGDQQTWGSPWAWRTGSEQFGSGGGGGGSTSLPTAAAASPAAASPANPELNAAYVQALMKLLQPAQATLADPDLASQSNANRVAQDRSFSRRRAEAAEQAAAGGQYGGGLEGQIDTLLSARGDAEGAFDADLLARKNDQNRQSQLEALGPAMSLFGLNQNESQFGRDIALRKALAEAGLNQSAILSLLGGL